MASGVGRLSRATGELTRHPRSWVEMVVGVPTLPQMGLRSQPRWCCSISDGSIASGACCETRWRNGGGPANPDLGPVVGARKAVCTWQEAQAPSNESIEGGSSALGREFQAKTRARRREAAPDSLCPGDTRRSPREPVSVATESAWHFSITHRKPVNWRLASCSPPWHCARRSWPVPQWRPCRRWPQD